MLRNLWLANLGLASMMTAQLCYADDDDLSLIELDEQLDEVEKPEELPPGTYMGEVQDVQIATSNKGNKYFAIKFVIPPEEIPADLRDGFPDGATMYWNRQVVPTAKDARAKFNLRRLIEALGLPTNTNQIDPHEWMGQSARLRVVTGRWEGQERAEIRSIEPAEAPARGRGAAVEANEAAPTRGRAPARGSRAPAAAGRRGR